MTETVVYKPESDSKIYHNPNRAFSRSKCGMLSIQSWHFDTGILNKTERENAEAWGYRACERCFNDV